MIIMKFGGTSVQNSEAIERLIRIVKTRLPENIVVVSSAMTGITDQLITCANISCSGDYEKAYDIIRSIRERHIKAARELIKEESSLNELLFGIKSLIDELRYVIKGINLISELSQRSIAKVSSFGELLSTLIITYALNNNSVSSKLIDARKVIITNKDFINAEPVYCKIKENAENIIIPELKNKNVVVTQGFIASTEDGITTTFSRGGSDYSASILGMTLDASEIEIWTDVDGILTADPRKVKDTQIIKEISFKEAAELAYFGAKVLHPSAILPAIEKNIPVRILNSAFPEKEGTLICADCGDSDTDSGVKSITSKSNITILNIYSPKMLFAYGFLKKVFDVFDKYRTSIDLVTTSEVNVSVTLDRNENLEEIINELSEFAEINIEENKSLVCVVGSNLKYIPGLIKKVFSTVGDYNITMISQGASIINISFIIDNIDLDNVLNALHKKFFEKEKVEDLAL